VFQPSIAGLDQAGVVEIAGDILAQRLASDDVRNVVMKDVFLTGGNTMFQGFDERVRAELRALLPVEALMTVRRAKDPVLDAWRGAAKWATEARSKGAFITKAEYAEKGADYLKVCLCRQFGLGSVVAKTNFARSSRNTIWAMRLLS